MRTPTRTGRATGTGQGRFARSTSTRTGRPSGTGLGRYARSTSTPRRMRPTQGLRRRQPEPTGFKKIISMVVPTAAAKKATPGSKKGKAGGLALVAAAAGMAFKNRGKIGELRRKQQSSGTSPAPTGTENSSNPPVTPAV